MITWNDVDLEQCKTSHNVSIIKLTDASYFDGLQYQRDFYVAGNDLCYFDLTIGTNLCYFDPTICGIIMHNLVIANGVATHVYNDCLSRVVIYNNIIWNVGECRGKIRIAKKWCVRYGRYERCGRYGKYYKSLFNNKITMS
jgi:hypothetical protein